MEHRRFVALGDSQTEGLDDLRPDYTPRGWADRLAEHLERTTSPRLTYANLAVRGCRARHVLETQLPRALELEPDLATVAVGMNDVLRHDYDLEAVVDQVDTTIAALTAQGARVLTMTFPDIARMLPVMAWLRPREATLNARLTEVAARHGADVLDLFPLALSGDPAMWSHDRIHASPLGHERIAEGTAGLLGLEGSDPAWAEPTRSHPGLLRAVPRDAWWLASFMAPFLYRQLRGHGPMSTGVAKRDLLPVDPDRDPTRTHDGPAAAATGPSEG